MGGYIFTAAVLLVHMTQLRAVFLDLDDTLLTYRRSPGELLTASFAATGEDPFFDVKEYYAIFDDYVGQFTDSRDVRRACFEHLARDHGRNPETGRRVAEAYAEMRDHTAVDLLPGAIDVVETLAETYPLAVITNGPAEAQGKKLAATGLDEYVDVTVFAGDDASAKPDPEPFERALDAVGVDPAGAIHVGDSLETDVRGAAVVGIPSVWIGPEDPLDGIVPDYRITGIDALLDLPLFRA